MPHRGARTLCSWREEVAMPGVKQQFAGKLLQEVCVAVLQGGEVEGV